MKHTLHISVALLALLGLTTLSFAQKKDSAIIDTSRVEKSVKALFGDPALTKSRGAHDDAVFNTTVRVESKWLYPVGSSDGVHTVKKPCSAVRIDENWLMASLTCRGIGKMADWYDHNGEKWEDGKEIDYRKILSIDINAAALHFSDTIEAKDIFVDEEAEIILMRIDKENEDLVDEIESNNGTLANLLIPAQPQAVSKAMQEAYINRERVCQPGRCSDAVGIDAYCVSNKCYKVEWEMIDGDAGDPLFIVSKKLKGAEFLAGFNNAKITGIHGNSPKSGRYYKAFDEKTKKAIEEIVGSRDKGAWARIQPRIKAEKEI